MKKEGAGRVSWRAFFLRLAVGLWLFEICCQLLEYATQ